MEEARQKPAGCYLNRRRPGRLGRWLLIGVLLVWDGVLVYMIGACLIHRVYGAVFVAGVSIYLGYQF